jgi:hypothetical protein
MGKPCTCVRCRAEELVRGIYPKMDDKRVLAVATDIVKALPTSFRSTRD